MLGENDKALLPAGLQDILSPEAAHEAAITEQLIGRFVRSGYGRIKPPILEFEGALLAGAGKTLSHQIFRLMDPQSQRMMGLRADMTPQIVRVAATRLQKTPRPLRLCYEGEVLRVCGNQLRPGRQFRQVGAELIGACVAAADVEVILLAVHALSDAGIEGLSVDLNMPPLVRLLIAEKGFSGERATVLRAALDRKDAAAVKGLTRGREQELFLALMKATGPAREVLSRARALGLSGEAARALLHIEEVVGLLEKAASELFVTIDLVEHRGFEYQTGLSFIFFSKAVRGELGRGGRYLSSNFDGSDTSEEAAGFSLFMDTVLCGVPLPSGAERIYVPCGTPYSTLHDLQNQGLVTVADLNGAERDLAEVKKAAQEQGCEKIYWQGDIISL